ncbi:alpha/beta hydrolase family protein [Kineococcus sp. SYSU DK005]|uniref:alpha/beta hydrolase family protein n=1 Tax=Kineococcus sp. SYSU DK005 TaxID=3383126 RepID=UPI003D7CD933
MIRRTAVAVLAVALTAAVHTGPAGAAPAPPAGAQPCLSGSPARPTCLSGTLEDGTPFQFVVPQDWNGTVVVALDFVGGGPDEELTQRLLADGTARGGTSRAVTGWDLRAAIDNQAEALDRFEQAYGPAQRAVASGTSMGGFVSAGVAQVHPGRFDAAVPLCGGLSGSVAQWNQKLDTVFVLERLVAPGLPVIDVPADVGAAQRAWIEAIGQAQRTPLGRARTALAAAVGQVPAWGVEPDGSTPPPPQRHDAEALQRGAYLALAGGPLPYVGQAMSSRRQIGAVVGGNPSWNTGVDYAAQLRRADPALRRAVHELYRAAGTDVRTDLADLAAAPRITADPAAVERFARGLVLDGDLEVPVLTVTNTGDQISTAAQDGWYGQAVRRAGKGSLLRQVHVRSAGHCAFSAAEQQAALRTVLTRSATGRWPATSPRAMNARTVQAGTREAPRFVRAFLPRFNRP